MAETTHVDAFDLIDQRRAAGARSAGDVSDADLMETMQRMQALLERKIIRRIGAVPNHYALGYRANGMTVWDVINAHVDELGEKVGALDFVTHCYRRPRSWPEWRYNLFAMVHGHRPVRGRDAGIQLQFLPGTCRVCNNARWSGPLRRSRQCGLCRS